MITTGPPPKFNDGRDILPSRGFSFRTNTTAPPEILTRDMAATTTPTGLPNPTLTERYLGPRTGQSLGTANAAPD